MYVQYLHIVENQWKHGAGKWTKQNNFSIVAKNTDQIRPSQDNVPSRKNLTLKYLAIGNESKSCSYHVKLNKCKKLLHGQRFFRVAQHIEFLSVKSYLPNQFTIMTLTDLPMLMV